MNVSITGKLGEPLKDTYVKPIVKFSSSSVFVWGCFTSYDVDYLCKIDEDLDAKLYCKILDNNLIKTFRYYELSILD
jgi:hypothetical protein